VTTDKLRIAAWKSTARSVARGVKRGAKRGKRQLRDQLQRIRFDLNWSLLKNPPSRRRFAARTPQLNDVQRRILRDLASVGIAFTTFTELFEDDARWNELQQSAKEFIDGTDALLRVGFDTQLLPDAEPVDFLRHNFDSATKYSRTGNDFAKSDAYLLKLYPEHPTVPLQNDWLQVGLDRHLLDVVNSYFQMWSKLTYFDLWRAIPGGHRDTRIGSQRWHRDPEDKKKLRIYLHLADVDSDSGPLQYIPGSFWGGAHDEFWKWRPRGKHYPPQEEFERQFSSSEKITCTGPAGTLVFVDTNGFHRGGIAADGSRILATWMFLTPAALHGRRYEIDWSSCPTSALSDAERFAVT
jgi:hypothetical protein